MSFPEPLNLTEEDGFKALRGHIAERAFQARQKYGPAIDAEAIRKMLQDPDVVRFPATVQFDAEALLPGEFAWARPSENGAKGGYTMVVHPHFEDRPEVLPLLVAYHIPTINYMDVVTHKEAELFGATLLGMPVDSYYDQLCTLADEMPGARAPEPSKEVLELLARDDPVAAPAGGGCGGSCSCGNGG